MSSTRCRARGPKEAAVPRDERLRGDREHELHGRDADAERKVRGRVEGARGERDEAGAVLG
jgi:hypothetical protein